MELPQLISVNAVNDLESRMQNIIASVIELDQPQQNWIRRVWIGSAGFDLETAVIGVKIAYGVKIVYNRILYGRASRCEERRISDYAIIAEKLIFES